MAMLLELDGERLERAVWKQPEPLVVDVWAPWCLPCRRLAPVLEELADEYAGRAIFARVNADHNQDLLVRHGIFGVPTVLVFRHGRLLVRFVGLRPKDELRRGIEQALAA